MSMILRRSRFVHQLPVGDQRILIVHAVDHTRLPADHDVDVLLNFFADPRRVPEDCGPLSLLMSFPPEAIQRAILGLVERGILTTQSPTEELASLSVKLAALHGRDPLQNLDDHRRRMKDGADPYWSVTAAYGLKDLGSDAKRVDALLFGDCDIQMEADFLRREAARRNIDLHVAATFPDDVRFASEHKHDVIFIGALRARHSLVNNVSTSHRPHDTFIGQAQKLLVDLRARSQAPILIDNLPEPTLQPLGIADSGLLGHRMRFRVANVALAEVVASFRDVHIIDMPSTLGVVGTERMLDDGLVDFTHFGSPGWMLQRPEVEKAAVHNIFPDTEPLKKLVGGNPYGRETAVAVAHIDALMVVLGLQRKKCVIVDLDGTLWPGVLAETGSPFAWTPEISGGSSFIGLYFGLHEALLSLKRRGIVLAIVSKNDEATIRELWKYPDHYPRNRLLTFDDFVTVRINWNDKVDNIRSIIDELGFAAESFLFIDDHEVERERVHQRIPAVEVWGDDPFALRRRLLSDPRLQLSIITDEAASRTLLVKSQLERQHLRSEIVDEPTYIASLNIECDIRRLSAGTDRLIRVQELFDRTTQFNTTGRKFSLIELSELVTDPDAFVFAMDVRDRFGDHGLVGAAIVIQNEIMGFVMSCRALGMGIEHTFLKFVLSALQGSMSVVTGRLVETPRNFPVRNLFRDHAFLEAPPGTWTLSLSH